MNDDFLIGATLYIDFKVTLLQAQGDTEEESPRPPLQGGDGEPPLANVTLDQILDHAQ